MGKQVHLVGSVPLEDAATVMSTCCGVLGGKLARVPDGETGIRTNWIQWQRTILGEHPAIEVVGAGQNAGTSMPRFGLRDGFEGPIEFADLGYQTAALESYQVFKELRSAGKIGDQRFQVCLPTPLAAIACYVNPASQEPLFEPYRHRLMEELQGILAQIPYDDLAIQWDVAIEFAVLEGLFPVWFKDVSTTIAAQLSALADVVPGDVELGFHFCYGDSGNKHFKEPEDMQKLVALANAVTIQTARKIGWIHMPVPIDRDDEGYFQPLQHLDRTNLEQLFLGLLHEQDGVNGANRRMQAADRFTTDYGIATECGLGRRKPEVIGEILDLHLTL